MAIRKATLRSTAVREATAMFTAAHEATVSPWRFVWVLGGLWGPEEQIGCRGLLLFDCMIDFIK